MDAIKQKENVINETLKNINMLSDADVVVGKPIITPNGTTIIPVSKITVGFLSGDGEYGQIKLFQPNKNYPSSTGSGAVASVKPCGFLVEKNDEVKYIHCPADVFEKAFATVEEVVNKINEN